MARRGVEQAGDESVISDECNLMKASFDNALEKYAELAVREGMNVQPGQRVFVRATRGEPDLAHRVARAAYRAGASLVDVLWEDDALDLIRVQEATRESLELWSDAYVRAFVGAAERNDAFLLIHSPDPELFANVDAARADAFRKARLNAIRAMLQSQSRNEFQWSVCRVPNAEWATRVYPDAENAREKLWDAIFEMCRVNTSDPNAAWRTHTATLRKRSIALTAKQYDALHYKSPVTDFTLGLPRGHIWFGGSSTTPRGISFSANIPTEEVFTLPHRERADGYVTMTRPLSINGVLIQNFSLAFENGRITRVDASNGQDVLEKLIASDEGAARLGEVALVPASNPIARMNTIFYDGLFDENAASHIAIGRAYRFTLQGGTQMSDEKFRAAGGNDSIIHEDTMLGSGGMDIDGIRQDGTREPVMRAGEWAFEV